MNVKKYLEKLNKQEQSNPGNKSTYVRPLRPRSTVFSDKKRKSRQNVKSDLKQGKYE